MQNDPRVTAIHEAAHAVISEYLGVAWEKAEIRSDNPAYSGGVPVEHEDNPDRALYDKYIRIALAGPAAYGAYELNVEGDEFFIDTFYDYREVKRLLAPFFGSDAEIEAYQDGVEEEVRELLRQPMIRDKVMKLTEALLSRIVVTRDEALTIIGPF